ncbi:MAG: CDP-glucose 4,6-dehydratase [Thermoanaerobacteraceae bacterium]|nr:CDP-glucose 4,6-dehydratase [Thermoanaerobacteraceae bacterium]
MDKNIFSKIYKNKKVLITGHTGFKGSWLTLWLKELGADVLGYSLEPPTEPNLFTVLDLEKEIRHIIGDIRDGEKLYKVFQEFNPEIVFHLAAQPLVRLSYKEPKLTYETNIIGTVNLYEAVRKSNSVKSVITITTDKCYENKEWVYGYRENDPMGGFDPYSSSKGCVELITSAYRNSYFDNMGIALSSVRAGNVIGGGDWAEDRLIPDFVKSLSQDKEIVIRNPLAIRPWQHVLEPLSGYLWLGSLMLQDCKKYSSGWNFGPNDEDTINVEKVITAAISNWGKGSYMIDKSQQPHEAKFLKLDISKARFELKWKPVYNVYEAIEETIDWYKIYYEGKTNMKDFTINQINEYIKTAKEKKLIWSGL